MCAKVLQAFGQKEKQAPWHLLNDNGNEAACRKKAGQEW